MTWAFDGFHEGRYLVYHLWSLGLPPTLVEHTSSSATFHGLVLIIGVKDSLNLHAEKCQCWEQYLYSMKLMFCALKLSDFFSTHSRHVVESAEPYVLIIMTLEFIRCRRAGQGILWLTFFSSLTIGASSQSGPFKRTRDWHWWVFCLRPEKVSMETTIWRARSSNFCVVEVLRKSDFISCSIWHRV